MSGNKERPIVAEVIPEGADFISRRGISLTQRQEVGELRRRAFNFGEVFKLLMWVGVVLVGIYVLNIVVSLWAFAVSGMIISKIFIVSAEEILFISIWLIGISIYGLFKANDCYSRLFSRRRVRYNRHRRRRRRR